MLLGVAPMPPKQFLQPTSLPALRSGNAAREVGCWAA